MGADTPVAPPAPPKWLIYVSAYGNIAAGISLLISFVTILLAVNFEVGSVVEPGPTMRLQKFTMKLEGILYAIAGLALTIINVLVNNAAGAVGQTIICIGGIFFFISGWNSPVMMPSLKYLIPMADNNAHIGMDNTAPFYGITCFMVATAYGLWGVSGLPKNNLVSPFWGVASFFLGAWTIGLFGCWIPLIAAGVKDISEFPNSDWPMLAWSWTNYFKVLGAIFLTQGAFIFAALDKVPPFCCGRAPVEPLMDGACEA